MVYVILHIIQEEHGIKCSSDVRCYLKFIQWRSVILSIPLAVSETSCYKFSSVYVRVLCVRVLCVLPDLYGL